MTQLEARLGRVATWCSDRLREDSRRVGRFIERNLSRMIALWAALTLLGGGAKVLLLVSQHPRASTFERLAPLGLAYLVAACTPLVAYALVQKCFPAGAIHAQPRIRLARLGRWSQIDPDRAREIAGTGISGLMVSIVAGLLLCMAMRLGEYSLAVPAIPAGAPAWAMIYFWMMTFDLVFIVFLYSAAVAMALNGAPLFPRLLVYAWLCDVLMQIAIARAVTSSGTLPSEVVAPLQGFLEINVKKVFISMMIWMPYLLLSKQVNAIFRGRVDRQMAASPLYA